MKNASGTAALALVALLVSLMAGAAAYFLLISPELDKSATARDDLASAQEFNSLLDVQILAAQTEAKKVDGWNAEIAAIRLDLPPTPEQAAFERLVNDSLRKAGLPMVSVTWATPTDVIAPASTPNVAVTTDPAEPTATDSGTGADASAAPSPSPEPSADPAAPADTPAVVTDSLAPIGFVQTPLTITTEGKPEPILRFLLDMQTQNSRFYTVTSFDISRSSSVDAQALRPALEEGDWVINITGLVFNLFDPELSLATEEPATTPSYTGDSVRNAFVPIPGTGQTGTP